MDLLQAFTQNMVIKYGQGIPKEKLFQIFVSPYFLFHFYFLFYFNIYFFWKETALFLHLSWTLLVIMMKAKNS